MADDEKLPSLLSPEIKKKLISADEARQLMVKSVRGLDGKLSEVSRIIQTSARKGETRVEVYSLQTGRSTAPIYERMDNLGRVLMEALRYAGYEAKLKEFRTADSCMLYIMADWSEIQAIADNPRKLADPSARNKRRASAERSQANSGNRTNEQIMQEAKDNQAATNKAETSEAMSDQSLANKAVDEQSAPSKAPTAQAEPGKTMGDKATHKPKSNQAAAETTPANTNTQKTEDNNNEEDGEVKTKKFDHNKLVDTSSILNAATASASSRLGNEVYAYSKGPSGERIPIILPIIMPL